MSSTGRSAFHLLAKPTGAACNLNCRYCFFLSKEQLYPGSTFRMSDDVLEAYLKQYLESQTGPEVTIAWQGGEPTLMGLEFFKRAVSIARKYQRSGTRILNTVQTNGVLLDDEWCEFFAYNDFRVGLSIDGPREMHDAYRVDKGDRGTFDKVMHGLGLLHEHGVDVNVLTTVHAANADHPVEVYEFLRDECKARFIEFIPIVERRNDTGFQQGDEVTERSVGGAQFGRFLIGVFDEWVKDDVGTVFVQMFDVALAAWVGEPSGSCVFSPTCGSALALEHNGDLYSCDHFVEPNHKLGNIKKRPMAVLADNDQQRRFGQYKLESLPTQCRDCDVRFACNGGCPKERFAKSADGEGGLNYLCDGYKSFFTHVDVPMRTMASLVARGRAPSEIMMTARRAAATTRPPPPGAAYP